MQFDNFNLENMAEAEQLLRQQLLAYGGVPEIAELEFGISRFFQVGWRQYEGCSLYISFTKTTRETTLVAEATIFQCRDDPTHLDFKSLVYTPDGLVLEFPKSCHTYADEIERTIMGGIESYISFNPRTEGQEVFKRYRIRNSLRQP